MASIASFSIDLAKIDKSRVTVKGKQKWLNIDLQIRDEINEYNQNVSAYHTQSKEERTAKADKQYLGNGKIVWTDGNVVKVDYDNKPKVAATKEVADLDF